MSTWPDLKFQIVERFIHKMVRMYGQGMDEEECVAECWRSFLEAQNSYPRVKGCCDFQTYAEYSVQESLNLLRRKRNERISLESGLPLDMCFEGSCETVGQRYFRKTGDFANYVMLKDFMERQGEQSCRILWRMYHLEDDGEIMENERLTPQEYYPILEKLQAAFREWEML